MRIMRNSIILQHLIQIVVKIECKVPYSLYCLSFDWKLPPILRYTVNSISPINTIKGQNKLHDNESYKPCIIAGILIARV